MKNLFPEFDKPHQKDLSKIWDSGLFVFDANVLLNLYRYQATSRDQFIDLLSRLKDRIWIPHYVAIEYQRNRLGVIADQLSRFAEVSKVVSGLKDRLLVDLEKLQVPSRHGLIDPKPLIEKLNGLVDSFLNELNTVKGKQNKLNDADDVKKVLEDLFDQKVGKPPSDQKTLDSLYSEAELRFKVKIPPGFEDDEKGKHDQDSFLSGGLIYKRRYGDFIVWRQMLEHAAALKSDVVVFVTDDSKEDWWYILNVDGDQRVGPRPELIDEARSKAGISLLQFYSPKNFMIHASQHFHTTATDTVLKDVQGVSQFHYYEKQVKAASLELVARKAAYNWLRIHFDTVHAEERFDFMVNNDEGSHGVEVLVMASGDIATWTARLRQTIARTRNILEQASVRSVIVLLISDQMLHARDIFRLRDVSMRCKTASEREVTTMTFVLFTLSDDCIDPVESWTV